MDVAIKDAYVNGVKRDAKRNDKELEALMIALAAANSFRVKEHMNRAGYQTLVDSRKVVRNATKNSAIQIRKAQVQAVNRAVNVYNNNNITWLQAKQIAINDLANSYVVSFVDKIGRHWSLDGYVEMGIRTGIANASRAGFDAAMERRGVDLVTVSSHYGSCPRCAPFQGATLSRSGANSDYLSVQDAMNSGLFHPNCRHILFEYIEGFTTPYNDDSESSAEYYRMTQEQRGIERALRRWKRRELVALTPDDKRIARSYVRKWSSNLENFTKANDLSRKRYREVV